MDAKFIITRVLPITAGAAVHLMCLYRDEDNVVGAALAGFFTSVLTSEIVSPAVGQLALEKGWM